MRGTVLLLLVVGCHSHRNAVGTQRNALRAFSPDDETCYDGPFGCCAGYIRDPESDTCVVDWDSVPPDFWDSPRGPHGRRASCTDPKCSMPGCVATCRSGLAATNEGCSRSSPTREACRVCMQPYIDSCQACARQCGVDPLLLKQACAVPT